MFITVINDCSDANAVARQSTRISSLFGVTPTFVPVSGSLSASAEMEAGANLIDVLDAGEGREGIVLVNVAPRSGEGKKWPNGTPFGWFMYHDTLVLSSVAGQTLSLVKKLRIVDEIHVFDIPTVAESLLERGVIDLELAERMIGTQFRSFEFLPRAAYWLSSGVPLPADVVDIAEIPDAGRRIAVVDNFGNMKTTILAREASGSSLETSLGTLGLYEHLRDVPTAALAAVVGSSGIGSDRFLEVVLQGHSAAGLLGSKQGDSL